ncbi:hypothetical protein K1719_001632 [Acacia pycnantha]|nr:hypothetical protein K1719_001632 [Acacia pycnantha]
MKQQLVAGDRPYLAEEIITDILKRLPPLQLRLLDWKVQIHQIHHSRTFTRIIGSINGLLGLYPLVLWNPATREVRQLPMPRKQYNPGTSTTGFGYSPIVNDYKIVRIYSYYERHGYTLFGAEVYSLSTDSWKDVDLGVLQGVKLDISGFNNVSANGSIFWLGLNADEQGKYNITAITLSTDSTELVFFSLLS